MMTSGNNTVYSVLKKATQILSENNTIESPRLDAEVLLCSVLNCKRIFLIINREKELNSEEISLYFDYIERRKSNEPVSYITKRKEFMSLEFFVCPGVLIPRPDTELLVEEIIKKFDEKSPKIIDICSGSGAISVSLAYYLKNANVYALDKYGICTETTAKNAKFNNADVKVLQADVFDDFINENDFDCIVSNPPYIEKNTIKTLSEDIKNFEPEYALNGGEDGLTFYRRITEIASSILKIGGILAYEIGYNQASEVSNIISSTNCFKNIQIIRDLSGNDRVVIAEKE